MAAFYLALLLSVYYVLSFKSADIISTFQEFTFCEEAENKTNTR